MCGWPAFREGRSCWRVRCAWRLSGDDPLGPPARFLEAFPTLAIEPGLYVIDRRRLTCAGGTAGLDLAIELIEREHGHKLAAQVSEWFIRTEPRPAGKSQRLSLRERVGISNDRVLRVLAKWRRRWRSRLECRSWQTGRRIVAPARKAVLRTSA